MNYKPIREFQCSAKACSKRTANWFGDGWMITGLSNSVPIGTTQEELRKPFFETETARTKLFVAGIIKQNGLASTLLCPTHADEAKAFLAKD